MVAPVALIAARLIGARTVLHVQDLEVDACFAVGHLRHIPWLEAFAARLERRILARFDRLITISARMADRLVAKGVASERIAVVRNWVDLDHIRPLEGPAPIARSLVLASPIASRSIRAISAPSRVLAT